MFHAYVLPMAMQQFRDFLSFVSLLIGINFASDLSFLYQIDGVSIGTLLQRDSEVIGTRILRLASTC